MLGALNRDEIAKEIKRTVVLTHTSSIGDAFVATHEYKTSSTGNDRCEVKLSPTKQPRNVLASITMADNYANCLPGRFAEIMPPPRR